MQKPQPPRDTAPYWAHRFNLEPGVEEIEVMVSGEGDPFGDELDPEDPESEQKLRQSQRGRLLAAILGQDTFDDFVRSVLAGEDGMDWSYGGSVTVAEMRLFAEIYDVPFDTVGVHLTDRQGQGLFLHGKRLHTEDEIAEARRPYQEALAQYERDLAEWERAREQEIQELRERRGLKYEDLKPPRLR